MSNAVDLTGRRFNKWTVLSLLAMHSLLTRMERAGYLIGESLPLWP